jgi:hypothetical protein
MTGGWQFYPGIVMIEIAPIWLTATTTFHTKCVSIRQRLCRCFTDNPGASGIKGSYPQNQGSQTGIHIRLTKQNTFKMAGIKI